MAKDLTQSMLHRQNVLNNRYAIQQVEETLKLGGIQFQGLATV